MELKGTEIIEDDDPGRRATLTHELMNSSHHVEPCDSLAEYLPALPPVGTILVHNDGDTLAETLLSLKQGSVWLPVVAYSIDPQPSEIVDALNLGALDYLSWPIDIDLLTTRLADLHSRFAAHFEARNREARAQRRLEELSRREREVLNAIVGGNTNKMIAKELAISPRTVEIHRSNAIKKIGAKSTAEAVRILIEGVRLSESDPIN